jgi:NADH-quinone oxidoreductase subunit M
LIPIFLITWWFGEADRKPILIKFFIYTFVGSIAMLASLIGMKVYASSFQIEDLRALTFTAQSAFWLALGFFIAFAVKIPLFPFHSWQPDTYTKAPMAGTMLLSAIMLKMALYGIIRWVIPMFPEAMPTLQPIIITVAIISTVYASIVAIMQQDIKRVFAYASMSHAGLIAAALMTLGFDGVSGSMVQIVNHGIVSVGLFLAAEIIFRRVQSRDFSQLGGFAALAPRFGFWFAALGFAAISVPFSSGFIGEFLMFKDLVYYNLFIGVVGLTTIIFGCVYIIRAYQKSMFGPAATASFEDLHWSELATLAVIVVLTAILGVYPALLTDFVNPSIEQILSISSISGH